MKALNLEVLNNEKRNKAIESTNAGGTQKKPFSYKVISNKIEKYV